MTLTDFINASLIKNIVIFENAWSNGPSITLHGMDDYEAVDLVDIIRADYLDAQVVGIKATNYKDIIEVCICV